MHQTSVGGGDNARSKVTCSDNTSRDDSMCADTKKSRSRKGWARTLSRERSGLSLGRRAGACLAAVSGGNKTGVGCETRAHDLEPIRGCNHNLRDNTCARVRTCVTDLAPLRHTWDERIRVGMLHDESCGERHRAGFAPTYQSKSHGH